MAENDDVLGVLTDEERELLAICEGPPEGDDANTLAKCVRRLCALLAEARLAAALSMAFREVLYERERQDVKWGEQNYDPITYLAILTEEVGEFAQAVLHNRFPKPEMKYQSGAGDYREWLETKRQKMRTESVHVAAVALAIVVCIDRGKWGWPNSAQGPDLPPREARMSKQDKVAAAERSVLRAVDRFMSRWKTRSLDDESVIDTIYDICKAHNRLMDAREEAKHGPVKKAKDKARVRLVTGPKPTLRKLKKMIRAQIKGEKGGA